MVANPGSDRKAREAAVDRLLEGLGYALHAGWIDEAHVAELRAALVVARASVMEPATLGDIAGRLEGIGAMRVMYRHSLELALRRLARPGA